MRRVFISDCEGPISKNDNAFEMTASFVPDGDRLFVAISRYDDVLADIVKKTGYMAGGTLKLILPFLRAYDVTDIKMEEFSARQLTLIANIKETLQHVRSIADAFIVSTSYEHYIRAMCHALEFPCENAYCTKLEVDKYFVPENEKAELKKLAHEIAQMPIFEIPLEAKSLKDLAEPAQKMIQRLDHMFWNEIASMKSGKIYQEVKPMGGTGKAEAIRDIVRRLCVRLAEVMYVGDSITDEQAFRLVKENGGLAVSFNGNQYAIENAEVAVLSSNSIVTAVLADIFCRFGKARTMDLVERWNGEALKESPVDKTLLDRLFRLYPDELPKVKIITRGNMETLIKESTQFRKSVRGEDIGRLG